jgi:signal peptidase I
MKGAVWTVSGILAVFVLFFLFINFSPDYNLRVVLSESMTPTLKLGDMILTGPPGGPFSDDIAPNSIITFHLGKELVTHRIITIESENLITQGDAVEDPDPWPVTLNDVDGTTYSHPTALDYATIVSYEQVTWDAVETLATNAADDFTILWEIPTSAGNEIQGDSLNFDVTFTLEQAGVD